MELSELLDELEKKALDSPEIMKKLLDTRKDANPMTAFCALCREMGMDIYEMDLIEAGESFYAAIKRSTNGGGENSPVLKGEDDFYEMFFADLERHAKELKHLS